MKKVLYLIVMAFLMASCISEPYTAGNGNCPVGDPGALTFTLRNDGQDGTSLSRATPTRGVIPGSDTYNENTLDQNDIHIFFYDANASGNPVIFYPLPERFTITEDGLNPGSYHVSIKLKPDASEFADFDPEKLLSHNILLYVVANSGKTRADFSGSPADEEVANSLQSIREMVIEAEFNEVQSDAITVQDKFVMDSYQSIYVAGWNNIAVMPLKRVAAKVEMGVYNATAAGYTALSARVKLVNYLNKSMLGDVGAVPSLSDADYLTSDYIPVPELTSSDGTPSSISYAEPFYSYASDWSGDPGKAAFLLLEVMWYESSASASTASPYYYKIPIGYVPSDVAGGDAFRDRMLRNYIYRFFVNITGLGGTDPTVPAELDANVDIIGWDDNDVDIAIQKFDWLFVERQNIIIYPVPGQDIQEYFIPYKSNTPLVFETLGTPGIPAAYYPDYRGSSAGNPSYYPVVNYPSNPADNVITQYPYVDPNYVVGTQRYIRVKSRTPVNYVPKTIVFKVKNEAELYATVTLTHYPALYVTAQSSTMSGSGSEFLYTVTTIAPTGTENFDWSWKNSTPALRSQLYTIGDPKNSSGSYQDNAENAWVVSPKFVIQSQRGYASGTQTRNGAIERCNDDYKESTRDGANYAAGTWRLPTLAELYLVHKIQNDSNSALKDALAPATWAKRAWAAGRYLLNGNYSSGGTIFNMSSSGTGGFGWNYNDGWSGDTNHGAIHVTVCVRDIYR